MTCDSDGTYVSPAFDASAPFECMPAGSLIPTRGTGDTRETVFVEHLRFPIENAPAYANSNFWRYKAGYDQSWPDHTGAPLGPSLSGIEQCDDRNYSYPWQDTFCEERTAGAGGDPGTPACPNEEGHQGLDIRGPLCEQNDPGNKIVAVAEGHLVRIRPHYQKQEFQVGPVLFEANYMHMEGREFEQPDLDASPSGIPLATGDRLGNIGIIGRDGTLTTRHLHFELYANVVVDGVPAYTPLPLYMTMVDSYRDLLAGTP